MLSPVILKKNEEKRIKQGHCWIYSNEIDTDKSPLRNFDPGDLVDIKMHNGKTMGTGYINPNALICVRLVSRDKDYFLNQSLIVHRLKIALSLRERLFDAPYYRLIFGDSDGLPGLIVDRFAAYFVVQTTTAGMERQLEAVIAALKKVFSVTAIIIRNDGQARALENLPKYLKVLGTCPDYVVVKEFGVSFEVSLEKGQKTGWFYDQRMNRQRMCQYVRDKTVLDVFSYVGAWSVLAALAGAKSVTAIDSSKFALSLLQKNASINAVSIETIPQDAFAALKQCREQRQKFDVIIVDPPAFIQKRKDMKEGQIAYQRINQMAMQCLSKEGVIIASSCSMPMTSTHLSAALLSASRHIDRLLTLLEQGHQAPDHPILPAIPETDYLTTLFCRVLPI